MSYKPAQNMGGKWVCEVKRLREKRPFTQSQIHKLICRKNARGEIDKTALFNALIDCGITIDDFNVFKRLWCAFPQKTSFLKGILFKKNAYGESGALCNDDKDYLDILDSGDEFVLLKSILTDKRSIAYYEQRTICMLIHAVIFLTNLLTILIGILQALPLMLLPLATYFPFLTPWIIRISLIEDKLTIISGALTAGQGFVEYILKPIYGCEDGSKPPEFTTEDLDGQMEMFKLTPEQIRQQVCGGGE